MYVYLASYMMREKIGQEAPSPAELWLLRSIVRFKLHEKVFENQEKLERVLTDLVKDNFLPFPSERVARPLVIQALQGLERKGFIKVQKGSSVRIEISKKAREAIKYCEAARAFVDIDPLLSILDSLSTVK